MMHKSGGKTKYMKVSADEGRRIVEFINISPFTFLGVAG